MKEPSLFGIGFERKVFPHPHNPERLIKESRLKDEESIPTIKGRFYLMKLLHVLFPKNVPDIHEATSASPQSITVEKKTLDSMHETLRTWGSRLIGESLLPMKKKPTFA